MAYDPNNLSALAYANGFTFWHYRTEDALHEVELDENGYFNPSSNMLRPGDFIIVNTADENAVYSVKENSAGNVRIAFVASDW